MPGEHPGRSDAQRRVLDAIGCGDHSPPMTRKTRDVMLRESLIYRLPDMRIGEGPLAVFVEQFDMPFNVHIAWCEAMAALDAETGRC